MQIDLNTLLAVLGTVGGFVFSYIAFSHRKRSDEHKAGERLATISTDLRHVRTSVDDLNKKIERMEKADSEFLSRVTECESNVRLLWEQNGEIKRSLKDGLQRVHERIDCIERRKS